jgi:hypothetical protein
MQEIISVRSNIFFTQEQKDKSLSLTPVIELVIVHTSGKEYELNSKDQIVSTPKIMESRMLVSSQMLKSMINDLELINRNMNTLDKNADKVNKLLEYMQAPEA